MDPLPPHGGGQPPPLEDSNTTPAAWLFDAAFTFSAFGLAQNPFSVGDGEITTVTAPTMNPQFMNYQFNQVTYGNGNPPMTAASEPTTTFFTQNNVLAQSPVTTARRAFGSTPSVLQYAAIPAHTASPAPQEPRVSLTTNKTPPPNVQFGKRKFIGLKTYHNGEPTIQRRIIRYGLEIYQQPLQGKTFTEKHRRAIVHPPILRLWLVESHPVDAKMTGIVESLPHLLEDDAFWKDTLVDISTLETAEYLCIVDALSIPDDGAATSTDDTTLLPSGYRLANTVPVPAPSPTSQTSANVTQPSAATSTPHSSSSDNPTGSAISRHESTVSRMLPVEETASAEGSRRPSADVRKASFQLPMAVVPESLLKEEPSSKRERGASSDEENGSPTMVQTSPVKKLRAESVASASLAPPNASTPSSETTMYKRNLMGNWAMGCRKMYGMGTPDDLGIWFVFNDISIQQPGKYALQFKCFNLHDTRSDAPQEGPPPCAVTNLATQELKQETTDQMEVDGQPAPDRKGPAAVQPVSPTSPSPGAAHALPLCTTQSTDFTVYGLKGMPAWPHPTELTSHFIR